MQISLTSQLQRRCVVVDAGRWRERRETARPPSVRGTSNPQCRDGQQRNPARGKQCELRIRSQRTATVCNFDPTRDRATESNERTKHATHIEVETRSTILRSDPTRCSSSNCTETHRTAFISLHSTQCNEVRPCRLRVDRSCFETRVARRNEETTNQKRRLAGGRLNGWCGKRIERTQRRYFADDAVQVHRSVIVQHCLRSVRCVECKGNFAFRASFRCNQQLTGEKHGRFRLRLSG